MSPNRIMTPCDDNWMLSIVTRMPTRDTNVGHVDARNHETNARICFGVAGSP